MIVISMIFTYTYSRQEMHCLIKEVGAQFMNIDDFHNNSTPIE